MARFVKGTLFVEYVRMLRSKKDVDWSAHLQPQDMPFLAQPIEPMQWYPMETFERFGLAILREIAKGSLEAVQAWGRYSIDELRATHAELVAAGDAVESLMRFQVLRGSFFDFRAIEILEVTDGEARIQVAYGMSGAAEEAASYQTLGFFERLLELAGVHPGQVRFDAKARCGDPVTIIELDWA